MGRGTGGGGRTGGGRTGGGGFVKTSSGHLAGTIKPAARPSYSAGSQSSAVGAAARMSAKYNRPMYVYVAQGGFGSGYGITYKKSSLSATAGYIEVSGRNFSIYTRP